MTTTYNILDSRYSVSNDLAVAAINAAALTLAGNVSTAQSNVSSIQTTIAGLKTVAFTGAYSDLTGKPIIPSVARTTSSLSLSLVGAGATGTQISSTKDSKIRCVVSASTTSTIGGPGTSVITLKKCATNSATESDWSAASVFESDQNVTLAIALSVVQLNKGEVNTDVPAGWYVKLVSSGSGTHAEAFISGEKTIFG